MTIWLPLHIPAQNYKTNNRRNYVLWAAARQGWCNHSRITFTAILTPKLFQATFFWAHSKGAQGKNKSSQPTYICIIHWPSWCEKMWYNSTRVATCSETSMRLNTCKWNITTEKRLSRTYTCKMSKWTFSCFFNLILFPKQVFTNTEPSL